ncbi:DUF5776 domain-containing protein [Levilactobacillus lindianensis]|uniref:DUF5776 domain-containing protein n=1 Tax=Levilactobacillus lindianensis TaxID=2486018 RepID=UPI000F73924E|nr:DUF5776 domain-containing protein [Levilactobacillus lindianensis]
MKRSVVGVAVAAGVAFCGVQVLGTVPTLPTIGTEVVAHASDAKVVDSGTLGTCPWNITADGVLHVESGTLPEAYKLWSNMAGPLTSIQIWENGELGENGEPDHHNFPFQTISFDGQVKTPVNASFLFSELLYNGDDGAPQIKNWQNLDTSDSTNFSFMFYDSKQDNVDVSHFNTSKALNMHGMFSGTILGEGYENLNTRKVTDMGEMFREYGDDNPSSLDLSSFDVSKVNSDKGVAQYGGPVAGGFTDMFAGTNVKNLNIGNWKPNISLAGMFSGSDMSKISKLTLSPQDNLTDSKLLGPDTNATKDSDYTGKWENSNDQYLKPDDSNKTTYTTAGLISEYNGSTAPAGNQTYQWEPVVTPGNPVTIHYIAQDGKTIQPDTQLPGALDATYTVKPATIKGYQYVSADAPLTGTYTADPQSVTLTYKVAPVTPGGNGSGNSSESSNSSDSSSTGDQGHTKVVAKKDRAITAVKKIGFYNTPDFSKKTRQYYYAKQKRTRRPQFVITGVAQSKNGFKRYLVRDVTPGSKRYGKTGYITAKRAFTVHTYYQHNPKRVKVILGTNVYRDKVLKHRVKHLKRGTVLHVKKIVRYHLTTRLVLSDGSFVTSNKMKVLEK